MQYDVIIAGCGPAGAFTAKNLAEYGHRVLILEEHKEVGRPVRCAGLISKRTLETAGVGNDVVLNSLTGARVISPQGTSLDINTGRVQAVAIDRAAFDYELAINAENAGAGLVTGTKLKNLQFTGNCYKVEVQENGRHKTYEARLVIGADGARSTVAKCAGLKEDLPTAAMYSAEVEIDRKDTVTADIFVGQDLAPGWFGWIIPLDSKRCRVGGGYALKNPGKSPHWYFNQIVSRFPEYFKNMKVLQYTGGIVPIGTKEKMHAPHLMLVGDAAGQVKPISGGGVYPGLRGAQLCADTADKALKENHLNERSLLKYQLMWEKEFGDEIRCGLSHRQSFVNFSDKDIEQLLQFLKKPYWRNMIVKHGDIDYPSRLSSYLFKAGPWMRKFIKAAVGMAGCTASIKNGIKDVFS